MLTLHAGNCVEQLDEPLADLTAIIFGIVTAALIITFHFHASKASLKLSLDIKETHCFAALRSTVLFAVFFNFLLRKFNLEVLIKRIHLLVYNCY